MTVDDGNGRVSMAILSTKLDNIEALLKAQNLDAKCDPGALAFLDEQRTKAVAEILG